MQFKHPEILYALLLLLIPIFIHLFQLRRFQKVEFTNVDFLKKVVIQTRKSSIIKKWLTLLMRLLALACLVVAFAQPYKSTNTDLDREKETVLYVDNSFSMQAKGAQGNLLDRALQDLFDRAEGNRISWFTNNSESRNVSIEDFKNEILRVEYSPSSFTPHQVLLKADQLFSNKENVQKQLLYLSDFQQTAAFPEIPTDITVDLVQLKPVRTTNVAIDSVFIASKSDTSVALQVQVSTQGETPSEIPISLFNQGELISKSAVSLADEPTGSMLFDIDVSGGFIGKLELTEANVPFDNTLFFSINKPEMIKVLSIDESDGSFLQRLFDDAQFQLTQFDVNRLEYNRIPEQNLVVLNQLKDIPNSLSTALQSFSKAGGSVLIIPSKNSDLTTYNKFLGAMQLGQLSERRDQEKKITKILFSHPLFSEVFEKEVRNFQYPKVNSYFDVANSATPALLFEDNRPFLIQSEKNYLFTAPIDENNSNFLNSPLVVPSIYNMGLQSLPLPSLYFTIGKQHTFAIPVQLGPNEILSIKKDDQTFIPLQQTKANHVAITTSDIPEQAGNYEVVREDELLQHISYNYSRSEGILKFADPTQWENAQTHKSIPALFTHLSNANSIHGFWKWFAIFAFVFLIGEMLILKFLE